jgi:hypothetical protein
VVAESTGWWGNPADPAEVEGHTVRLEAADPVDAIWKVRDALGDRPYGGFDVQREVTES